MPKLKVWCDSGANIHSRREEEFHTDDLGITEEDWAKMSEDEKAEAVRDIALDRLDWGFQEL